MSDEIKKGLLGIVVDETTVSQVMPDINSLTYRGYAVQDLCAKCNFEEVAYLVLNGELPNKKQLKSFIKEERLDRKLSKEILSDIRKMPKKAHPMDVARTAIRWREWEDRETKEKQPWTTQEVMMKLAEELKDLLEEGKVKISIVPDIESINYGRGVGYEVIEHVPPENIKEISATKIREKLRDEGKL